MFKDASGIRENPSEEMLNDSIFVLNQNPPILILIEFASAKVDTAP